MEPDRLERAGRMSRLQSVVDERPDTSLLARRDCEGPPTGKSDHDRLRVSVLDTTSDGNTPIDQEGDR